MAEKENAQFERHSSNNHNNQSDIIEEEKHLNITTKLNAYDNSLESADTPK